MELVALEFVERTDVRIAIAEVDDEPNDDLCVFEVIKEAAGKSAGAVFQRPADRMYDLSRNVFFRVGVPKFLETNCVVLRCRVARQIEFGDQLFAEVAATTL